MPRAILANCPKMRAILDSVTIYFLIYAVFMKPNCTSTKSDHSQRCTWIENNYILGNRRGLMFQFPLCGEHAAVGKQYVSGNETQMSLTLWSEVCDVFKEAPYEMCPSLPTGDLCSYIWQMSKLLPVVCFKALFLPTVLNVYRLVCLSAVSVHVCWRQY